MTKARSVLWPDDLLQKLDRGALLKLETLPDRGAGIDHDADPQRQIRLLGEVENLRGSFLVIEQSKVTLLQILDEPAMLVSDGKDQIHLVDVGLDGEIAIVLPVAALAMFGAWGTALSVPGTGAWSLFGGAGFGVAVVGAAVSGGVAAGAV